MSEVRGSNKRALHRRVGDIPFILLVLVPGYVPMWPGILGPILWIAGLACTAIAQVP